MPGVPVKAYSSAGVNSGGWYVNQPSTHSKRAHDRWQGAGPLSTDYTAGISGKVKPSPGAPETDAFAAADALDPAGFPLKRAVGYPGRRPTEQALPQEQLTVPGVCGSYAIDYDASGHWLDFAFV
eukprot:SAG31_NODE_16481_length_707_cov_1.634868_1_plen_124_part_10